MLLALNMNGYKHITHVERRLLGRWRKDGVSLREIARRLCKSPSTISREVARNRSSFGYCCNMAHTSARLRRRRANQRRRKITTEREGFLREAIERKWSPEQAAAGFERETGISISAVSVYRWVHDFNRGGRFGLAKKLRRRGRPNRKYNVRARMLEGRPMIDQRPESVAQRRFYGDWEADPMLGPSGTKRALLVLVERKSKLALIRSVRDRKSETVSKAIIKTLAGYKVRTITYDNGAEFSKFREVAADTHSKPFFCQPYHAWEKGLVENTIGLLREYFPKASKEKLPSHYSVYQRVQHELNARPRKTLEFKAPTDLVQKLLQPVT